MKEENVLFGLHKGKFQTLSKLFSITCPRVMLKVPVRPCHPDCRWIDISSRWLSHFRRSKFRCSKNWSWNWSWNQIQEKWSVVHTVQWSLINSFNCYFNGIIQSVPFGYFPLFTLSLSQGNSSSHLAIISFISSFLRKEIHFSNYFYIIILFMRFR